MSAKNILLFVFVSCIITASAQSYNRVISLAPSITQSIYYLEAQDKLVGRTSYCKAADKDNKPIVANAVKINMERTIALKPDLVIVLGLTDPKDIETLNKFGIKVEVFQSPQTFEEICEQFIHLGDLVGKKDRAQKIVSESETKLRKIRKELSSKTTPKVFFQIGANPLFTVTPNTFMDDYINKLGAKNISADLTKGIIGKEFVVAKNPDYIFVCTMGVDDNHEVNMWKSYPSISAVKNKRIFSIDADIACQPTPISFIETLELMSSAMHK